MVNSVFVEVDIPYSYVSVLIFYTIVDVPIALLRSMAILIGLTFQEKAMVGVTRNADANGTSSTLIIYDTRFISLILMQFPTISFLYMLDEFYQCLMQRALYSICSS